jgi:3-dehydroquinate dehydratase/shikimate dehydrogenase
MTRICVTLTEETTAALIDRMADLAGVADLFEVRGDLVLDLDLLTVLRAKTRPLLFSCRPVSEGGRFPDDDPRRRLLLLEAVKRGYDYVDVEYRSGFLDVMVEKSGRGLIVSHHDLQGTPEDLDDLYQGMCALGADVVKVAVTPRSFADVGRLLDLAARAARRGGAPLLPVPLGPLGIPARILAGRYGAPFTYASARPGAEAAPGQLPAKLMADLYRVREINPATQVYGILGARVSRSLSPRIHNRAFAARGLDAVFVPLQAEALEPFVAALPSLELAGFSVTQPYKVAIVPYLQALDEAATAAGSVNTVVVKDGKLHGATTDGLGVVSALEKKKVDLEARRVLILGAGGAARSAALALRRRGAQVAILARDPAKAAAVAAALGCGADALASLPHQSWDVLVNATPVGSRSAPDQSLVPAALHRPGAVVFDMVYDPVETPLLREAQAAGCVTIDGLQMLLAQAAAQFAIWTGTEAPADVMRSVALYLAQEGAS